MVRWIFISIFIIPSISLGACPDWIKKQSTSFPTCPQGEMIPETYPVGAVVVSDEGYTGDNPEFTADFVAKTLQGAGPNTPAILLPVKDVTFEKVKARINTMPVNETQKAVYLKSLLQVPTRSFTWQQDYFQAFVNPATGRPVLRSVEQYSDTMGSDPESVDKLTQALAECGITQGTPLRVADGKIVNGAFGGNIQTLPSGICALGDDNFKDKAAWKAYADQFCGKDPNNRIVIPTSWLLVGHTDEVMKTIRNKNQLAPCDFSVMVASPRKAIELLKYNPDKPFLDFVPHPNETSEALLMRRNNQHSGLRDLCTAYWELKESTKTAPTGPTKPTKGVTLLFENIFIAKAFAGLAVVGTGEGDCTNLTNGDVVKIMTAETELKKYNELVQQKMDALKIAVGKKLKKKFPKCRIDVVDTPDLFYGGSPVKTPNGEVLPDGMGLSLLPNPTNAVSINDTVISPEPGNAAFKEYIKETLNQRGLKAEFVDTFDYAHLGQGNLHCSSHTMHVCSARGKK